MSRLGSLLASARRSPASRRLRLVVRAEPAWYERLRYPLRYEAIVARPRARTTTSTRRSLAAVIYQESKFDADARARARARSA